MSISRRSFLLTGAAVAAAAGTGFAASQAGAAPAPQAGPAASPAGDVVGKVTVGYQGWFAAPGDGAPINGWWHWSPDMSKARPRARTARSPGRTSPSTRARTRPRCRT
ncbi:twin-arginine translocation signal domain-containing protein [Streptomyces sp. DfronAA-171]|uniref:twin-arginine translocation signal domain-containing protein n=1 Tax=Streptomyces sp. DfronAA-171 TaxID=1839777 RepID=UPI00351E784A